MPVSNIVADYVHEFSIATGLVEMALRHAGGRPVTVVSLRVGSLRQVVPTTLAVAFELASRGTDCEGARLEQELVPCRLSCPSCGVEWTVATPDFRCRGCGWPAVVISGNELRMEWIEVEDDPPSGGT
ncbi:MAG: hydrogenase maturation nickel metallochaperone HypA [Solirubrobacteraceae bacterium]